jgi:hypothetical protein
MDNEGAIISAMEERLKFLQDETDKLVRSGLSLDVWDLARDMQREIRLIRAEIQKLSRVESSSRKP